MKVPTFQWLPKAIALPLFISILNIVTPAGAEQIARFEPREATPTRSKIVDIIPSVTDLNLIIPAGASELSADLGEQSSKTRSRSSRKLFVSRNTNVATAPIASDSRKSKFTSGQKIAAISGKPLSGNYLRLVRNPNKGTNDIGNPIYTLETYINGQRSQTFNAVSGTANTQNADRNRGNNSAPLPDGLYQISSRIVPGVVPEVGKTFIGIYPKFETGRSDLGIHLDRSFNKQNGYDGTSGCIGIGSSVDRDAINKFVAKYRPRNLLVNITF